MKNNELKAAAEALRPNVNAPELSENAYRQACDDILALIDQLDEPVVGQGVDESDLIDTLINGLGAWSPKTVAEIHELYRPYLTHKPVEAQYVQPLNISAECVQNNGKNEHVDAQGVDEEIVYGKMLLAYDYFMNFKGKANPKAMMESFKSIREHLLTAAPAMGQDTKPPVCNHSADRCIQSAKPVAMGIGAKDEELNALCNELDKAATLGQASTVAIKALILADKYRQPMPNAEVVEQLLTDMRCQAVYTVGVHMPVPLYERIKAFLQSQQKGNAA